MITTMAQRTILNLLVIITLFTPNISCVSRNSAPLNISVEQREFLSVIHKPQNKCNLLKLNCLNNSGELDNLQSAHYDEVPTPEFDKFNQNLNNSVDDWNERVGYSLDEEVILLREKRFENYDDNYTEFFNDSIVDDDYFDYIFPKTWTWVLIFFHFIVFVVGLVGNCLVCVAVYRNHTMRTVTNYFIVNLAVADFLVIFFCLPPSVVWDVTSTWWFGTAMCKVVLYLQNVSVFVSILTLTFISIDRWYAICFPLKFKSTTGRAKTAIGIIWIVALACDIPEAVYLTAQPHSQNPTKIYFTQCAPTWSIEMDSVYIVVKMVIFYVLPLLFISVAYIQIIRVLWKSGNAHQAMDLAVGGRSGGQTNTFAMNTNASTEGQLRSRRKAAKMLVAVVVMFAICFLPVNLLDILRVTVKLSNSEVNRALSLISHWLCYANSAVNPIIYNFMSGKFRKEFRRAFDSCCQRNHSDVDYQFGTFSNKNDKDSGIASRSQSRNDYEIYRLNTYKDYDSTKHLHRKGTRSSTIKFDI